MSTAQHPVIPSANAFATGQLTRVEFHDRHLISEVAIAAGLM